MSIELLIKIYDKFTKMTLYKVLLIIFNFAVFLALFSYIEYYIIYKVAGYSEPTILVKSFVLLPFLSIVWLRLNPSFKNLLTPVNITSKFKFVTNSVVFIALIYELIKYCPHCIYMNRVEILPFLLPLHYFPGGLSAELNLFENYNLVIALFEVLIIAVLLLVIYIKNFDNTKKCPNCGTKCSYKQKFCKKCGSKLS